MESDIKLLAAAREMNEEALIEIFDHYNLAIYNYAFRSCNNAVIADQIVGIVFAKLVDQLSTGQGPKINLRSYLYEIAHHIMAENLRYSRRATPIEVIGLASSTEAGVENRMLFKTLLRAIANDLTDDQRQVIILRFQEGFTLKETAAIIGKTVGNVKVIQNRGIAALRKALDYQVVETGAISILIRSMAHA